MSKRHGNACFVGDNDPAMAWGQYSYQTDADGLVTRTKKDAILRRASDASVQQKERIAVFGPSGVCLCVYDSRSLADVVDDVTA
jgi:hypothetical protein